MAKKAHAKKSIPSEKVAPKNNINPKKKEERKDESADSTTSYYQQKKIDKLNSLSGSEINELI